MPITPNALVALLCAFALSFAASCGPQKPPTVSAPPNDASRSVEPDTLGLSGMSADDFPPDEFIEELPPGSDSLLLEETGVADSTEVNVGAIFDNAYRRHQTAQQYIRDARAQIDTALALLDSIPEYADTTALANRDEMVLDFSRLVRQLSFAELPEGPSRNEEIPLQMNRFVEREIQNFQTIERAHFLTWYERSGAYVPYLKERFRREGMPEHLAWLPFIESGFSTRALSSARALGLWQFIASTGYRYGLRRDRWIDQRMDFERSTTAAIAYLRDLHDLFGDWNTALAAYNSGEGRVLRTINRQRADYMDDFWDLYIQLPSETARYVPRFHALLQIIQDPEKYGFTDLPETDAPLEYDTLSVNRQVQLSDIAARLRVGREEIERLNPELRSKITPGYPYTLRVPKGMAEQAAQIIGTVPETKAPELPEYVIHRVRYGETLSSIAQRYRTSVWAIQQANGIRNPRLLRAGQRLRVPTRAAPAPRSSSRSGVRSASGSSPPEGTTIHVVQSGDTLWSISQRYSMSVAQIRRLNGLSRSSNIYPGQKLIVSAIP